MLDANRKGRYGRPVWNFLRGHACDTSRPVEIVAGNDCASQTAPSPAIALSWTDHIWRADGYTEWLFEPHVAAVGTTEAPPVFDHRAIDLE